jgi:tetratricopeptide (TPR) repeat protein
LRIVDQHLHLLLGESLSHLERYTEAEAEFREEMRAFPANIAAYSSLALLYHASNREEEVATVLEDLVDAAPTPAGYSAAARLWAVIGERSRAEAVRADARARFKGDPSLALLGRDVRR